MADSNSNVIHSDPEILGGTLVFVGTRVPVHTLLDYLQAGDSLLSRPFPVWPQVAVLKLHGRV